MQSVLLALLCSSKLARGSASPMKIDCMRSELDENDTTADIAGESDRSAAWWDVTKVACWVSGLAILFLNLNWGAPDQNAWLRLKSALDLKSLLLCIAFF